MVLESLFSPRRAEKEPWELFLVGLAYAGFSFLMSWWVFKEHISLIMVTLTAICSVPLLYNMIKYEAMKDNTPQKEYWLIKEHGKAVSAFTFLFLGFVAAFLILFVVLPVNTVNEAFSVQIDTISQVTSATPTGNFISTIGNALPILANNMKILIFCFVMSFFFGAGAIFILTWNASVVGVAIGIFIRNKVMVNTVPSFGAYSQLVSIGVLKYMTHGIFEIVAYFVGALAGGILSIGVIKHEFGTPEFRKQMLDSLDIMAISIIALFLAALIEVFVTPLLV